MAGVCLLALLQAVSADDCVPWTWAWNAAARRAAPTAQLGPRETTTPYVRAETVNPGEINCRNWAPTYSNVGYWTCSQLADTFGITLDLFWILNPDLAPDCDGILPNTEYCVDGCKSFLVSSLGRYCTALLMSTGPC
jgi:hypothetical protein